MAEEFDETLADTLVAMLGEQFDRSRFVPGVGPLDANVMLVGEAPGAEEVKHGEPFVGQAGKRLNRVLADLEVKREAVYITNAVKVRPPDNRTPRRGEVEIWRPILHAEIERVDPAIIITLGTVATQAVLNTDEGITELHGRTYERDGRLVVPTYHPAAIFYDKGKLSAFKADLRRSFEGSERGRR